LPIGGLQRLTEDGALRTRAPRGDPPQAVFNDLADGRLACREQVLISRRGPQQGQATLHLRGLQAHGPSGAIL